MNIRLALVAALPAALFLFAACGDGPDKPEPTVAGASPTVVGSTAEFGPEPVLGENIVSVSPGWAERVKQASTRTANPTKPGGLCAVVDFKDLPETIRWFRLVLDETEVTTSLTWAIAPEGGDRSGGRMCYAPAEGIPVGVHSAAIAVQDPNNVQARSRQIVAWKFEVTE